MELLKFNLNYNVLVKIKDKGIEKCVKDYNSGMPFNLHTSFKEYKSKANKDGYHKMQMHAFIDSFGGLGFNLPEYVDLNILIEIEKK